MRRLPVLRLQRTRHADGHVTDGQKPLGSLGLSMGVLLGGSWAVISGVISRVTISITHVRGLI